MNLRRVAAAFLLALLISGTLTLWLSKRLTRPRSVVVVPMRQVVVARKDLRPGDTLTAASLQTVSWPAQQLPAGVFASVQDVAGRSLLVPVASGEPVLPHHLALLGAGPGLLGRIPVGMRAISVHTDEASAVSGFAEPGSKADILAVYRIEGGQAYKSAVVLQNVTIVAVGQRTDADADGKHGGEDTVTVLVTPQDANRLTLANSVGKLQFVLRNGTDGLLVAGLGDNLTSGVAPPSRLRPSPMGASALAAQAATAAASKGYEVETVAGATQTKQTFPGGQP